MCQMCDVCYLKVKWTPAESPQTQSIINDLREQKSEC